MNFLKGSLFRRNTEPEVNHTFRTDLRSLDKFG